MSKFKSKILILILSLLILSSLSFASAKTPLSTESITLHNEIIGAQIDSKALLKQVSGYNGETVGIIVDPSIWVVPAAQAAINQYAQDLNYTGYTVVLDSTGASNIVALKTKISLWYTNFGISGVVLIGNLPSALFYHPAKTGTIPWAAETFLCELFLTDLDGTWTDTEPDGIYDIHSAGTGDIYPEIYLGRIDATSRTLGGLSNDQDIVNLLTKIHNYRIGTNARTHQAMTYIDDDWQAWANGTYDNWPAWLNNAYPTRTDIHTPATLTTAADWLTKMTQNYEWVHLAVHSGSSPAQHYFGPGGIGEGTVTSAQIHAAIPAANFYNLYCCSGADTIAADCLATTYLYSGNGSIAVIGTSKTGGMFGGATFYDPLALDKTIGQAFEDWFQTITTVSPSDYLEWFYGMVILGDPFLTIDYDCTVYQPDVTVTPHANPSEWYTNLSPTFNMNAPFDVNGVNGYYIVVDHNPSTVPTISSTFTSSSSISTTLTDGIWYAHISTLDGAGNIADPVHFQINIDSTNPTVIITAPDDDYVMEPGDVQIDWNFVDSSSGYDYAEVRVNSVLEATVNMPITTYLLSLDELGTYTIQVTLFDNVGLSSSDTISITVQNLPTTSSEPNFFQSTTFYIILGAGGGTLVLILTIVIIVSVKRKRV